MPLLRIVEQKTLISLLLALLARADDDQRKSGESVVGSWLPLIQLESGITCLVSSDDSLTSPLH
jgi:hypothetical protein